MSVSFVHLIAATSFIAVIGCKKNVDPTAFDGGTTLAPVVATAAAPASAAAAASTPEAPLASLTPPTTPPPPAAGTGAPKAKVNKNLPECNDARKFCNHPAAGTDKAIQDLCTKHKQACFAKGGVL